MIAGIESEICAKSCHRGETNSQRRTSWSFHSNRSDTDRSPFHVPFFKEGGISSSRSSVGRDVLYRILKPSCSKAEASG